MSPLGRMEQFLARFYKSPEARSMTLDEKAFINRLRIEHEKKHEELIKNFDETVDKTLHEYMGREVEFIKKKIITRIEYARKQK